MKSDLERCIDSILQQIKWQSSSESEKKTEEPFPDSANGSNDNMEGEEEEQKLFNRCMDLVRHLQWSTLKEPESMAKIAQRHLPKNVQVKIPWLYAIGEHVQFVVNDTVSVGIVVGRFPRSFSYRIRFIEGGGDGSISFISVQDRCIASLSPGIHKQSHVNPSLSFDLWLKPHVQAVEEENFTAPSSCDHLRGDSDYFSLVGQGPEAWMTDPMWDDSLFWKILALPSTRNHNFIANSPSELALFLVSIVNLLFAKERHCKSLDWLISTVDDALSPDYGSAQASLPEILTRRQVMTIILSRLDSIDEALNSLLLRFKISLCRIYREQEEMGPVVDACIERVAARVEGLEGGFVLSEDGLVLMAFESVRRLMEDEGQGSENVPSLSNLFTSSLSLLKHGCKADSKLVETLHLKLLDLMLSK